MQQNREEGEEEQNREEGEEEQNREEGEEEQNREEGEEEQNREEGEEEQNREEGEEQNIKENMVQNSEKQPPHNQLLSLLISFLKHDYLSAAHLSRFLVSFRQSVLSLLGSKESFMSRLSHLFINKEIHFVRHAQSTYNQWRRESVFNLPPFYPNTEQHRDVGLTNRGREQAMELGSRLEQMGHGYDTVLVSALSRAIQTYLQAKNDTAFPSTTRVMVTQLLSERQHTSADLGTPLSTLKQRYQQSGMDFGLIGKELHWQWSSGEDGPVERLNKERDRLVKQRMGVVLLMVLLDDNIKRVCLFSHSQLYRCIQHYDHLLSLRCAIQNGEIKKLKMDKVLGLIAQVLF